MNIKTISNSCKYARYPSMSFVFQLNEACMNLEFCQYLFQHLHAPSSHCKGVLIVAGAGFGKTTIVEELVEFSSFGDCRNNLVMEYLSGCHHAQKLHIFCYILTVCCHCFAFFCFAGQKVISLKEQRCLHCSSCLWSNLVLVVVICTCMDLFTCIS